jgi:hypothetical protein
MKIKLKTKNLLLFNYFEINDNKLLIHHDMK